MTRAEAVVISNIEQGNKRERERERESERGGYHYDILLSIKKWETQSWEIKKLRNEEKDKKRKKK